MKEYYIVNKEYLEDIKAQIHTIENQNMNDVVHNLVLKLVEAIEKL